MVGATAAALALSACGGAAFSVAADAGNGPVADAGADVDGGPGFCAAHAGLDDFCSDFDESPLPAGWDAVDKTPAGGSADVTEDSNDATSSPSSLLTIVPALPGPDDAGVPPAAWATLTKRGLPPRPPHVELDFKLEELDLSNDPDTSSAVFVLSIGEGDSDASYAVALAFVPAPGAPFGVAVVELQGLKPTAVHPLTQVPPIGEWMHVKLDLATAVGGQTLSLSLNGKSETPIPLAPPQGAALLDHRLTVGAAAVGKTSEAKLRVDNVIWSH